MSLVVSTLLRLTGVSKSYGGVRALDEIDWSMEAGEVHALCGENGAGKSTLIKILGGVVSPDEGTITFLGRGLEGGDVAAAERAGIAVIHQESTAFPDLNAVDNIFVGREVGAWGGGNLDFTTMRRRAEGLLSRLGETLDLACPLRQLPLAQRQMVAMARALACDCKLLIMDEPTASLSARETEALFALVRRLRQEGVGILYVSHRLDEIFTLADRITVLRDGRWIDTKPAPAWTRESLIQSMVGRVVQETIDVKGTSAEDSRKPLLRVRGLTRGGVFEQVDFELRAGEILGLGGLVGAGRSEVARCLFGIDRYDAGEVWVQEERLPRGDVEASIAAGIALVPEDRQSEGLVLPLSIQHNVSLAVLRRLCRRLGIVSSREKQVVGEQLVDLGVKHAGMEAAASTLSGGNQQKLVLGKWLATEPRILILDEPTRGVDVGAKAQFHQLIRQLASRGLAVLLISSDLPELLALSDRILVMREGHVVTEMGRSEATQERVLELALPDGHAPNGHAFAGASTITHAREAPRSGIGGRIGWMLEAVRRLPRREASVLLLVGLLALAASLFDPGFLSLANLRDILVRAAPTAIVCCGVMLVVVTGEIDISVGSLTALLAAFLGLAVSRDHGGWPCWIALPLLLAAGSLVGWLTGLLVTVGRVPSIMATLGLLTALRGTTTLVMRGGNIQGLPEGLTAWAKHGLFEIPLSVWVAALVVGATAWLIHRTALGRRLYALGSSPESAAMAGLPAGRLKRFAFAYTGFLVALATIVEIPRLPQIEAGIGSELELLVVTCVVVGGVAIRGGRGTLTGVMLAVLLMTMIRPVLTFLAVGESGEKWAKAIQGLLILVAVVADSWMTRRDPRGTA